MSPLREPKQGKPFSEKLRQVYYCFRSRKIGLEHIAPLIKYVLLPADINISTYELPSKSTAAKVTSELGIIAGNQQTLTNITMQRDATTKKGRHFVCLELSTGDKILTAGRREVENGKAITYVDYTKETIKDIEDTTETHGILPKLSSFMTDRSVTEQKANLLISNDGNINS
ncbi:unnamed protein product [Mytilus coruscus]|uniref:Uncharacterized protein n=1 Tax=Mytilus coruscus TaxID=42192 RepID=A0A6J8AS95_MYTCO|nr:unnamed protein product [Mytilus coruscus]